MKIYLRYGTSSVFFAHGYVDKNGLSGFFAVLQIMSNFGVKK